MNTSPTPGTLEYEQAQAASQPPRETREWWAVTDMHDVVRVTGFSCAPNNPAMWWVPSLGYSMREKHHLFEKEIDAVGQAIRELVSLSDNANKQIGVLMARRTKI